LLGTNLSEEQIKLLVELNKRIILFLDNDKAGQEATINVAAKLLSREVDCEVIKNNYQGDPDEICRQQNKENVCNILQTRENPYLFILNYYYDKWEVEVNPQRISRFVNEVAEVFRKFKPNIYEFLINKISSLTGWEKEEIEPHFIHWNFPSLHTHHLLINYGRELIEQKEKKIVYLCAKERTFWIFASEKSQFFLTKTNRTRYHDIYNYYMSSPSYNSYLEKCPSSEIIGSLDLNSVLSSPKTQKGKIIDMSLQELDNVRKFLLNYE